MPRLLTVVAALLALLALDPARADDGALAGLPDQTGRRVALVIGNGDYQHTGTLANPRGDAAAMAALFKDAGFTTVESKTDVGVTALRHALADFEILARDADVAVVYYSGHGIEVGGQNYLVPVDAAITREVDVQDETVSLDRVLQAVAGAKKLKLVILDACRADPFAATTRKKSVSRGLARIEPSEANELVAYAARAGTAADDGDLGAHGPFTAALITRLAAPGVDVEFALRQVRDDVLAATHREQEPFFYGSMGGQVVPLVPARAPTAAAGPGSDEVAWSFIEDTSDPGQLAAFIRRFDKSPLRPKAEARLAEVNARKVAALADQDALDQERKAATLADEQARQRQAEEEARKVAALAEDQARHVRAEGERARQVAALPVAPPVAAGPCGGATLASLSARAAGPLSAGEECALAPKDEFRECDQCPAMVVVPAGSFTMGSPVTEKGRYRNEGPQHVVTFAEPFAVGKFAVTFDEWDACVAGGGCGGYRPDDQGWGRGSQPVTNVSWNDAKGYTAWLSATTGKAYRLPSEAEREYFTRAGTVTAFWWGNSISIEQANYDGTSYNGSARGKERGWAVRVDSFAANPWGLFQVHGNVWEVVEDCAHDSYVGAPTDGRPWPGGDCGSRMARGGSSNYGAKDLRSANRTRVGPDDRAPIDGFRVARALRVR